MTYAEDRYNAVITKQNRRTFPHVTSMFYSYHWLYGIFNNYTRKATLIDCMPAYSDLCFPILPLQSSAVNMMSCLRSSRDLLCMSCLGTVFMCTDDKWIRIWKERGTGPQNFTEQHIFRCGSIMMRTRVSLGYNCNLHIFKRGCVTSVRYES